MRDENYGKSTTPRRGMSLRMEEITSIQDVYEEAGWDVVEAFGQVQRGYDLRSPAPPSPPDNEPGYRRLPRPCTAPGVDGDGFDYEEYRQSLPKNITDLAERHEQTIAALGIATRQQLPTVARLERLTQVEGEELGLHEHGDAAATSDTKRAGREARDADE